MSLRTLTLKSEYRSNESNVVDEFYVPCFHESIRYDRAVGYFTGEALSLAAKGLVAFINGNGHMRLIASPYLDEHDVEQIQRGYEIRERTIANVLERELERLEALDSTSLMSRRVASLAWLISEGRLEIKIAVRKDSGLGIYHEKLGIFKDDDGSSVAFSGSANETRGGLINNFESIDVFCSWAAGDIPERVERKVTHFEELWSNQTMGLEVFKFPDAAKQHLLRLRPPIQPERDPESPESPPPPGGDWAPLFAKEFEVPEYLQLYDHQERAIDAWFDSQANVADAEKAGFLEMATGSGKTIVALAAAKRLYDELGRLAIIVVAPTKVLVDQWANVAETFGLNPIMCHSDYPGWRRDAWKLAREYRGRFKQIAFLVATEATFSKDGFAQLINEFGKPILFIADEAHHLGAPKSRRHLPEQAEYRLALSATPERPYDDEGSAELQAYFGSTVFNFSLREAIGICLTPYDYEAIPVELMPDEMEDYAKLTAQMAQQYAVSQNRTENQPGFNRIANKRASLVNSAAGKIGALAGAFDKYDLRDLRHTFVYATDKDRDQTEQVIDLLQNRKGLLVHQFTEVETSDPMLRKQLLERFEQGENLQILVAKRCLDEGVDIPATRRGFFLASTANPRQYIQRRGRLLRMAPGKDKATIVDFIVVPPDSLSSDQFQTGQSLVSSELRRVREFAECAYNGAEVRLHLLGIAERWDALDVLVGGG